jgi:hypothetical protein
MESGVCLGSRTEERQPVAIGHKPASRRSEGKVCPARQPHAQRLPIQPSIEQTEVAHIDIYENAVILECGQIERQALDRGSVHACLLRCTGSSRLHG